MTTAWTQSDEPQATGAELTLVEGSSFVLSQPNGDMHPNRPEGVFVRDTRVVSTWRLLVDGQPIEQLSAVAPQPYAGVFLGRARPHPGHPGAAVIVERRRYVGEGLREDLTLHNHRREPVTLTVALDVDADFADVFEVKSGLLRHAGRRSLEIVGNELHLGLRRGDLTRGVRVIADGASISTGADVSAGPDVSGGRLSYRVAIPAQGRWTTTVEVVVSIDGADLVPRFRAGEPVAHSEVARELAERRRAHPTVHTDWTDLHRALTQSEEDLDVLRLADPDFRELDVVAAGAPWFMTLFGRDALLAGWMMLPFRSDLALGSLRALARLQGTRVDPATDEQPGRIPHELRRGFDTTRVPGRPSVYYGTIDATPLFVMLVGELRRWGHPSAEIEGLLPAVEAALGWIERYGDRDGDGFVEYLRANDGGLRNQGWKDSFDAVNYLDGTLAEPPIALAEVQGYVYAAYLAGADLASDAGDIEARDHWSARAATLRQAFNERFWLADHGWFAMALDRDKRPVDALTSNIGHCLWTGIVDDDKAAVLARRLLDDDLFSGFGIRTLSSSMGAYNPVSYHNGSVWPHDNALIAAGLMRYGFVDEARRVATGIIDAAAAFGGRLPELFCGFGRAEHPAPVPYPASSSPQAWAAAAPVQILRTLLRLDPDVPRSRVWLSPVLAPAMSRLRVEGLRLDHATVDLDVTAAGTEITGLPPELELVTEPRPR